MKRKIVTFLFAFLFLFSSVFYSAFSAEKEIPKDLKALSKKSNFIKLDNLTVEYVVATMNGKSALKSYKLINKDKNQYQAKGWFYVGKNILYQEGKDLGKVNALYWIKDKDKISKQYDILKFVKANNSEWKKVKDFSFHLFIHEQSFMRLITGEFEIAVEINGKQIDYNDDFWD